MKASIRLPGPIARAVRWNIGLGLALGWMLLACLTASAQQLPNAAVPAGVTPAQGPLAVRTHACVPGRQAEIAEQLRAFYGSRDDLRIAADPTQPQIFVFGPADVQEAIARQLAVMMGVAAGAGKPPATAAEPARQEHFIPLKHVRAEQIEPILARLLGARLARSATPAAGVSDYVYADFSGRRVEIRVDRSRNGLAVRGPEPLVAQFVRLVTSLDEPGQSPGQALRIMPVRKADPARVEEAVRAYQSGRTTPPAPLPGDSSGADPRGQNPIGLVGYMSQPGAAPAAPGATGVKAIPATEGKEEQTRRLLRAIGSDVEVEMLPDLDVIILRGRDRDVDEVTKIIEELERLSVETQPVVEVYPLKHIGGESLVTVVGKIQDMIIGGRQGRVSVIPLVKPNALLIIGWGDAVKAVKDVIQKVDQPTLPESEFRVFPLKYAPVNTVRTTVQEFFTGKTGLNTKVQVSADARTNSLLVQAPPQEMSEMASLVEGLDRSQSAAVNQTRIFKLKYSLATDLATTLQASISASTSHGSASSTSSSASTQKSATLELLTVDAQGQKILRSGVLSDVQITADPRLNTLIVTGPAESMDLIAALIQQLDAPMSSAQIKVFRIVNGDAASLVQMLRSLLPSSSTTTTTGGTSASFGPQLSVSPEETSLVPLRFSIDVRTNSVIAVGATGDLKIVEALLLRLDERDVQQRKSEIYRLKNSPAVDVATAINEFLRSKRQVEQAAAGAVSPFQQIEAEVVVVPEPVSNSLIISATPRFFDEIKELVEKLDAQPSQVLIQVMIAEVDLQNFNEFGVELGLQDSLLFDRSLLGALVTQNVTTTAQNGVQTTTQNIIGASNTPGFAFNNQPLGNSGSTNAQKTANLTGGQGLSHFNVGRTNTDRTYGGLVLSASSESVSVLIRALQETRCMEVLARPQIMTLDNQPAYIQVGQRVPRIAGTAVTQATQVNSIVLENVGLILSVTPRISPEGLVVMEIDAERSKLGKEEEGVPVSVSQGTVIRSPAIDVATAQTTVSARSGETIVLAGLITKAKEKIDRKVPLLADIPVLGNLFRYKSDDNRRTELMIVLTPHVVRTPEEAERAKQLEAAKMHWCLRDVEAMHGPINVAANGDLAPQSPVIYPDSNPRGILPPAQQPVPAKAPGESKPGAIVVPAPPPATGGTSEMPWPAPLPTGSGVPTPATPMGSSPMPDNARYLPWPDTRGMYVAPTRTQNAQNIQQATHLETPSR